MRNLIVHLSDPHFGTEVPGVVRAVQRKIKELHPHILVVSGDVTQRARCAQFEDARMFLDEFTGMPTLVIPGNHDIPLFNFFQRLTAPYKNYQRYFPQREPRIQTDTMLLVGIDATTPFRHTRGELHIEETAARIHAIRSELPSDVLLGLCIHQPALVSRAEDVENLLVDSEKLVRILSDCKVDLVLSGHIHLPFLTTSESSYPSLPCHFVFSGAGTALSKRVRPPAPNSFNTVEINSNENEWIIELSRYDYSESISTFSKAHSIQFHRGKNSACGWKTLAS